ncbi:MAG: deoxyhypusine synthase family protein [Acidobacteria bacterium]|nr:deoxyhypusine synthase family protein [Acidobacteriota bacterium]
MSFPYEEFDLSDVRTYPLGSRKSKASVADFATPHQLGDGVAAFVDHLPNILGAADFRAVVRAIVEARDTGGGIIWGFGAHVIKTGVSPILIDLARRGFVSALATNGAGIIHDFEIALGGSTSENVDEELGPGRFGMAEETGRLLNRAINEGVAQGLGIGQSVGKFLAETQPPFGHLSVAATAAQLGVPLTVHVALGTDITHMHPDASGEALGAGSLRDFRYFVSNVARLNRGVYLNCGSAVVLPEVFLKAVALARNRGIPLTGLTTVNLDFARLYRPQTNVVTRPVAGTGGHGYSLVGQHEILIPLLAAAIIEAAGEQGS